MIVENNRSDTPGPLWKGELHPGPDRQPAKSSGKLKRPRYLTAGEPADHLARAKEWLIDNPLPCLAAAFFVGVAIAWIVKRR